jgi:hypothetical protein
MKTPFQKWVENLKPPKPWEVNDDPIIPGEIHDDIPPNSKFDDETPPNLDKLEVGITSFLFDKIKKWILS